MTASPPAFTAASLTALRVVAGLAFASHGAQKLLGWFGGVGPDGGTAELMSRYGIAGVIELAGGPPVAGGLRTDGGGLFLDPLGLWQQQYLVVGQPRRAGHVVLLYLALLRGARRRPAQPGCQDVARTGDVVTIL